MRKRSIRFVQDDNGVGLFDEQIKHEDRRDIGKRARKKKYAERRVNRNKNSGLDRRKKSSFD